MSLLRLITTIRALPATPFRTGGQPQLSEALEGIVARSLSLPPNAGPEAIQQKDAGMSDGMRRRVLAAEQAVLRIEGNEALKEVSWLRAGVWGLGTEGDEEGEEGAAMRAYGYGAGWVRGAVGHS